MLLVFVVVTLVFSTSDTEPNNPVFNLDHTALEKNIAAIFNKVAHSSATTKRSVPAYEAQISQSTVHSTTPSQVVTSSTTSFMPYQITFSRATSQPHPHELPSYAPPPRALFTPPLPPEYANPFADKPTLRGTNIDAHSNMRRPIPPPSLTPVHERIPIKPPDLIEDTTKSLDKTNKRDKSQDSLIKDSVEMSDRDSNTNGTINFVPSLHFTSISRILSGSNGRKQDIPEILLKPIPTKVPQNRDTTKVSKKDSMIPFQEKSSHAIQPSSTVSTVVTQEYKREDSTINDEYYDTWKKNNEVYKTHVINTDESRFDYPQTHQPATPSKLPGLDENASNIQTIPVKLVWKIAWSLHVYITASLFTLIALFSVYKIVRYNDATNLLTQTYFLAIHLLLTLVCTLRCFYLFYDAYNLGKSLPEVVSRILMFLPSSLLTAAFATLILFMSRCSTSLHQSKLSNPAFLILAFIIHITLCLSLHVSSHVIGYSDESKILPLICRCIFIIICITLGLCYMYVYRVIRSQLNFTGSKSMNEHVATDITISSLNTAITTTFSTALLFILMGFLQLYGIFGVPVQLQPFAPVWWGWEFSVRLTELAMCSLLAWVSSLSQYHLREKQIQQHVINSGFALFPCGNSTSTENIDDALYPAICSTNQAIQNYTLRTGKQVYDDSFPLNTLPDQYSVANTIDRHSNNKKTSSAGHFSPDTHNTFSPQRRGNSDFLKLDSRAKLHSKQDILEYASASGSTMLVAEDGFVRFRNIGVDEKSILNKQKTMKSNSERRSSASYSDRFDVKQSTVTAHKTHNSPQNSLPHVHSNNIRNQHQLYNNT